jgi:hypothetical protein
MLQRQLFLGQAVGLRQHGLALVVEILPEQDALRAIGIRVNSHTPMLPDLADRVPQRII